MVFFLSVILHIHRDRYHQCRPGCSYLHIVYNVISQLLFGFPLEMVHSWWRTAIIYLTGVTAGTSVRLHVCLRACQSVSLP